MPWLRIHVGSILVSAFGLFSLVPLCNTFLFFSFFFFGGLISQAILAHLFSYNITWGATKKEVERSNFWVEVPKILKRFWLSLVIPILMIATMIVLSLPFGWKILPSWAIVLPLA